jgi:hypothetical protein
MQARLVVIANDEHANGFWITALETGTTGIDSTHIVEKLDFGDRR